MARIKPVIEQVPVVQAQEVDPQQMIASRAHELWIERGCPIGSPDEDWFRAEEEIRHGGLATSASRPSPQK